MEYGEIKNVTTAMSPVEMSPTQLHDEIDRLDAIAQVRHREEKPIVFINNRISALIDELSVRGLIDADEPPEELEY